MKKYAKTGSVIPASKVLTRTGVIGPFLVFAYYWHSFRTRLDTATQISAITLSAVTSTRAAVQIALVLTEFFALGMILTGTLDSIVLRSASHRIFNSQGFRYMTYALSGSALTVTALESYSTITGLETIPEWTSVALAGSIIAASFAYAYSRQNKRISILYEDLHEHGKGKSHIYSHKHLHLDEQKHEHEHEYEHDVDVDRLEKDKT